MPLSPNHTESGDDQPGAAALDAGPREQATIGQLAAPQPIKRRRQRRNKNGTVEDPDDEPKRRVVTTACIACRKRKSKCDGNTPACAACSQVYGTACIYDPLSDHRRKGVYKSDVDELKTKETTLRTIVQALLNYAEDDVPGLVRQIRTCDSLDDVADSINAQQLGIAEQAEDEEEDTSPLEDYYADPAPTFESKLGTKMGELRLDDGSVRYIGGTSHLLFLNGTDHTNGGRALDAYVEQQDDPVTSWTSVTQDAELITHLLNLYFTWHYSYFTCLSRSLFYRDFLVGKQPVETSGKTEYCTPLLVNAMLALGCHFTNRPEARDDPDDPLTAGQQFFSEAKRLLLENDEHEKPKIATVQALALMSVREAGCGREARGWVYSGMSFRMAQEMGLHLDSGALAAGRDRALDEGEEDARRITFWGCFLFDKCWSNYMGRLPQLPPSIITCPHFDVFPDEDAGSWTPYGDGGTMASHMQPARTRAVALHITGLCEISSDLMRFFYNPGETRDVAKQKGKQAELKKLSEIEIRLESWRKALPKEMEAREGCLPSVFIMHMFFQLLFIHLFRPFLQYTASTSPLPPTVSPRKLCTTAATTISRLLRLYKRTYGLRQICNICIYIIHTACTIHLLNLPEKDARRDFVYGVKHLEEIAESWPGARRTLTILGALARQWQVQLPEEAAVVLQRCELKFAGDSERNSASPAMLQPLQSGSVPPPPDQAVYHPMQQHTASQPSYAMNVPLSSDHDLHWVEDIDTPLSMPPPLLPKHVPAHSEGNRMHKSSISRPRTSDLLNPLPQTMSELLESLIPQQSNTPTPPLQDFGGVRGNYGNVVQHAAGAVKGQHYRSPSKTSPLRSSNSTAAPQALRTQYRGSGVVAAETAAIDHPTVSSSSSLPGDGSMVPPNIGNAQPGSHHQHRQQRQNRPTHQQQAARHTSSSMPAASQPMPSGVHDMFGGVEQLLRDVGAGNNAGSEWMLRDQSALAWGFGNWDLAGDATGWSQRVGGGAARQPSPSSDAAHGGAGATGVPPPGVDDDMDLDWLR